MNEGRDMNERNEKLAAELSRVVELDTELTDAEVASIGEFVYRVQSVANRFHRELCVAVGSGLRALRSELGESMPSYRALAELIDGGVSHQTLYRYEQIYAQMQVIDPEVEERMSMMQHRTLLAARSDELKRAIVSEAFRNGRNPSNGEFEGLVRLHVSNSAPTTQRGRRALPAGLKAARQLARAVRRLPELEPHHALTADQLEEETGLLDEVEAWLVARRKQLKANNGRD